MNDQKYCIDCKHCVKVNGEPFTADTNTSCQALCNLARDPVYRMADKCENQRVGPACHNRCGESGYYWMARE